MITPEDHVKVLDFGLAKRVTRDKEDLTSVLTREGTTLGTLAYMSPEQLRGSTVDARADVFSLGVVLYEMLTGVHPFSTGTQAETVNAILSEHPSPVSRYVQGVPDRLQLTMEKMLAKQPGERYQTVHEIRTNLTKVIEEITSPTPLAEPEQKQKYWMGVVGALGVILILVLAFLWFQREPAFDKATRERSVAVLPLVNLSGDPEDEYFSDGITEDIITKLFKIGGLRVISRSSVMRYKDTELSLQEIAQQLDVAMILEGSVRKSGDQVRIVAQLIDANSDEHLWAETYDRHLTNIFTLQSDVAEEIATALGLLLSPKEKTALAKIATKNTQAYDLYLAGRHYLDLERIAPAIDYFERAIELDSGYADAYADLAWVYYLRGLYLGNQSIWEKTEELAQKSVELDPTNATAYKVFALLQERRDGDLKAAEESFKKALELDPQAEDIHRQYGGFLRDQGRLDEALVELKRAYELNPLGLQTNDFLWQVYSMRGELDQAIEFAHRILEFFPSDRSGPSRTGSTYQSLSEYAKAETWLKRALEMGDSHWIRYALAYNHLYQGRLEEPAALSKRDLRLLPDGPFGRAAHELAGDIALWSGDYEKAHDHYQKSVPVIFATKRINVALQRARWGYAVWKLGNRQEAEKLLAESAQICEEQLAAGDQRYQIREALAMVHAIRGEDEALRWLQEAIDAGWHTYDVAQKDPIWENLRDEARFQQMMAEVKVKVDEMRLRVRELEQEWEQ
jgi:TolB-like protein/predicted Zn-dependent protease